MKQPNEPTNNNSQTEIPTLTESQDVEPRQIAPFLYENWKHYIDGEPELMTVEYPLFRDAHIVSHIISGFGPYQLHNAVPIVPRPSLQPTIILRASYHLRSDGWEAIVQAAKTNVDRYHGGSLEDEMAALISLCLGIRCKAGGATREFSLDGDEKGQPRAFDIMKNPILIESTRQSLILPQARGRHSLDVADLLLRLYELEPSDAVAIIRAARLYQDALWIVETQSELAWILMVSAVESVGKEWIVGEMSPIEHVRIWNARLARALERSQCDELAQDLARALQRLTLSTRKFVDFLMHFMPPPPSARPPEFVQVSWQVEDMAKSLHTIYNLRNAALHTGTPFPKPICNPPWPDGDAWYEKPVGAYSTLGAVWSSESMPMLFHTFEYIVRNALLSWWRSRLPATLPIENQAG
ncbi:MAG TPA: hypothetical protein VF826_12710 [Chloroflexia bacterium]|jgi:hypothetical protein